MMKVRRAEYKGMSIEAAGGKGISIRVAALAALLTLLFFVPGCGSKVELAKDPFFEKWSTLAEESHGSSPAPRVRTHEIPGDPSESVLIETELLKTTEQKKLPQNKVTLKMRNADVPTVLRALARVADQNILLRTEVKGTVSVDFDEVPWDDAFMSILRSRGLSYFWEGNIIRVATFEDLENDLRWQSIREKRMEQQIIRSRMAPLHTMVIPVDYANVHQLRDNLIEFLTKKEDGEPYGSIRVNEHTNSLIVNATRSDLEKVVPLVDKMDQPTPQIRIEASIVETTSDTARNLGVQWGGLYSNTTGSHGYWITPGGSGGDASTDPSAGGYTPNYGTSGLSGHGMNVNLPGATFGADQIGASLGLMYGRLGGNILELQLQALQTAGRLNILSKPSITALDNQTAFTENGRRIPYVTMDEDGDQTVEWEDAVLRLEITPHVIDEDTLKMKIVIKKDEVDFTYTVGTQGNPVIIKKQTDTTLIVNDGETIVISGLSQEREIASESGVPGLKGIPGLRWLFRSEGTSQEMEEVLIFITPRILKTEAVASGK